MTLNELIEKLESIRSIHGGDTPVFYEETDDFSVQLYGLGIRVSGSFGDRYVVLHLD